MNKLLIASLLGFLWTFYTDRSGLAWFFVILSVIVIGLELTRQGHNPLTRGARFLYYLTLFAKELVVANILIAMLALKPSPRFYPHIIAVPLRVRSDAAIALLSGTITLLPGTVAMGVSDDKRTLYAHALGSADIEDARDSVTRMEDAILGFMR